MNVGDIVLYSVGERKHNAIVLHVHFGQPDHLGANGEPLLHLAFIAPERESSIERAKFGYIPQVFQEFDVVHHSHVFSDEYKKKNGLVTPAQIATHRGQGEWSESETEESLRVVSNLLRDSLAIRNLLAAEPAPPAHEPSPEPAPPAPPLHEAPVNPAVEPDSAPEE